MKKIEVNHLDSFGKVLSRSREGANYKDSSVLNFFERIKGIG